MHLCVYLLFIFFHGIGQYLTAIFYGSITYYAFPDVWQEQPLAGLFIGIASALAIATGNNQLFTIVCQ
jgi:hypothetical protein